MRKRMLDYIAKIEKLIQENKVDTNWKKVKEEFLIQIGFFQHERLIHLLVTCLFAILVILTFVFAVTQYIYLIFLSAALLVLLIPYIRHYYFLENKTQYLYSLFDKINDLCLEKKQESQD